MLFENEDRGLALMREILFKSDISDRKRVRDILLQEKSQMEGHLMSAGHSAAALRAGAYFGDGARFGDMGSGIEYYKYLCRFAKDFDTEYDRFVKAIDELSDHVFRYDNIVISTTGRAEALDDAKKAVQILKQDLGDRVGDLDKYEAGRVESERNSLELPDPSTVNEGFKTAGQVQYVCRAGDFRKAGFTFNGAMKILKVLLGYDYFWINIRVKGGAYGCGSNFSREGHLSFSSYRDPNLGATNDIFEKTDEYLSNLEVEERDMTKYIIGTISGMDTPLTPMADGARSFTAYMTGMTVDRLQKEREEVIDATIEDIRALADSADGRKLGQMIDGAAVESAVKSGDSAALQQILRGVLSTAEGQRLAENLRKMMQK
jgi:Zn-dependent M16 (insulinase) family peptidase